MIEQSIYCRIILKHVHFSWSKPCDYKHCKTSSSVFRHLPSSSAVPKCVKSHLRSVAYNHKFLTPVLSYKCVSKFSFEGHLIQSTLVNDLLDALLEVSYE